MRNRIVAAAMAHAHDPRTPKAELGESQVLDQPGLQRKCQALSKKGGGGRGKGEGREEGGTTRRV